ncbi:MAG: sensor histidine kinase [Kofleriaceae bacterium]
MPFGRHHEVLIREVGERSRTGTTGHITMLVAAFVMARGAFMVELAVIAFSVLIPVRIYAWWSSTRHPLRRRNVPLIALGAIGCNTTWGLLVLDVELHTRMGIPSVLFLMFACGIANGGVFSIAPIPWIQHVALSMLLVPVIVAGILGYGLPEFVILHGMFFVYAFATGRVAQRSFAAEMQAREQLHEQNAQLRDEIAQRLKMEIELRQAQKLEAIGRLASGIAHEINTPVQYVSDSCRFLLDGVTETSTALADYHALLADIVAGRVTPADAAQREAAIIEKHDLEYLRENLSDAAARSIQGLDRVSTIVRAMKEFAHHGDEKAPANLNTALENTLVVCRNEIKDVADVITELDNIPLVNCHGAEINQVFLNIIINAAHAVADTHTRGTIRIKTATVNENVQIAISDTGPGIPDAVIDKIFEPFFTTKPVGKGTGQGLAIVRSIVVGKHNGKLDVATRSGEGTTFTITLPIAA